MAEEKNNLYRQLLGDMTAADLMEGVSGTLDKLRAMGLKLAIGSSRKKCANYSGTHWTGQLL